MKRFAEQTIRGTGKPYRKRLLDEVEEAMKAPKRREGTINGQPKSFIPDAPMVAPADTLLKAPPMKRRKR